MLRVRESGSTFLFDPTRSEFTPGCGSFFSKTILWVAATMLAS
jgi:hypothetical protein